MSEAMRLREMLEPLPEPLPDKSSIESIDPRPDLSADSGLWVRLLNLAAQHSSSSLYDALYTMRQKGTRLKRRPNNLNGNNGRKNYNYALRPEVGVTNCWKSVAEYKATAAKLLNPHREQVIQLLEDLSEQLTHDLKSEDQDIRAMAMLDIQGFFAIKTEGEDFNGEKIYFVRDKQAVKQIPEAGAVFYTLEELQILIASSPLSKTGLKKIHTAKKIFGGTILYG